MNECPCGDYDRINIKFPVLACCTKLFGGTAFVCRDRLYAEILKKKREMHRLIKEKELAQTRQVWIAG